MDYAQGNQLPYLHWDQIYNPDFEVYLFQGDEQGEFKKFAYLLGRNIVPGNFQSAIDLVDQEFTSFISSAGQLISLPVDASDVSFDSRGTLTGFTVKENAEEIRYIAAKWVQTNTFAGYVREFGSRENLLERAYIDKYSASLKGKSHHQVFLAFLDIGDSSGERTCDIDVYSGNYSTPTITAEYLGGSEGNLKSVEEIYAQFESTAMG